MALFRKRKAPTGHPPAIQGKGFAVETGKAPYVSAHYGGLDGTASPSVANQQAITGLKQIGPDADKAPTDHYQRRNSWRIDNFRHELQTPPQYPQIVGPVLHGADDPKREPPMPTRPTAFHSPSGTVFTVDQPYGFRYARFLNGNHFSMASHRRAYPIAGMNPAKRFRNTFRLEPESRENAVADMPPVPTDNGEAKYVSPSIIPSYRAFRLG